MQLQLAHVQGVFYWSENMGNQDILKGTQLNSKGYGTIAKLAMQDRNLDITAKAVYAYFNSFSGAGDNCFPTRAKICYDLKISNDTLGKYLRQLVENGYITVMQVKEKGRFSHNVYTINQTVLPCPKISDTENFGNDKSDTNNNNININNNINNNSNNKESKKASYDKIIDEYTTNEELKQALIEFIKMRKLLKKPLSNNALSLNCTKLDKLANSDYEKIEIVNQSVMNSWLGFYPLKNEKQVNSKIQGQQTGNPFLDMLQEEYEKGAF